MKFLGLNDLVIIIRSTNFTLVYLVIVIDFSNLYFNGNCISSTDCKSINKKASVAADAFTRNEILIITVIGMSSVKPIPINQYRKPSNPPRIYME